MTASRLASRQVEKLWGRAELPRSFGAAAASGGEPIGEIWFEDGRGPEAELLVKYLLTREKLSIQVHPDGEAARAAGHRRGKDEAWLVLEAEPGARIGLGLRQEVSPAGLRAAIEAGTLEALVDWREAKAGDFYYSPAGTIHALGPGLTLVRLGGHFDGGTVLHWADWSEGRGVLLSGDILQVVPSGHVSFMWSYPNLIPLAAAKVQRMAEILEPFAFDAVYGSFSGRGQIDTNGKQVVAASVARYIARISET